MTHPVAPASPPAELSSLELVGCGVAAVVLAVAAAGATVIIVGISPLLAAISWWRCRP